MFCKNDWETTRARLTDLWNGKLTGRPCISVQAPRPNPKPRPAAPHTLEDCWLDPEWKAASIRVQLENTWWGGESIPSQILMAGWVVSAGGQPHFAENTIWFETTTVDFKKPSPFRVSTDDPWIQKHRRLYQRVAEESAGGRFHLGHPCFLPAHDLLSMHMGTESFLMALMDEPQWMKTAIHQAATDMIDELNFLQTEAAKVTPFWYGNAGWMAFWAPQPFAAAQSDVSCMLSPEIYEEFAVPELDLLAKKTGAMWYHLDGHDARQHLPRLLSLPYMRVIQYTPTPSEPPNGPDHLEFYKTIQKAGRIVHIPISPENIIALAGKVDPSLIMFDTTCSSEAEGRELLKKTANW